MNNELHVQIRPGTMIDPEEFFADFPFEEGQSIVNIIGGVLVIDLGSAEDTNYVQDWYLNNHEDVQSYFVLED